MDDDEKENFSEFAGGGVAAPSPTPTQARRRRPGVSATTAVPNAAGPLGIVRRNPRLPPHRRRPTAGRSDRPGGVPGPAAGRRGTTTSAPASPSDRSGAAAGPTTTTPAAGALRTTASRSGGGSEGRSRVPQAVQGFIGTFIVRSDRSKVVSQTLTKRHPRPVQPRRDRRGVNT